jgi:Ras-related protein Rab-1A
VVKLISKPYKKSLISLLKKSDYLFKYLIIGNSGVGKSCLLIRFTDDTWSDSYVTTIGVDFKIKTLDVDGKSVKLQIWDTAGQERFRNIISSYYRGAQGIMLVYDITDLESFQNLNSWLIEIEKNASKNVYKILVGNKCDMESERKVTVEQGKDFAAQYGMKFFETSAKESTHVSDSFIAMTREIIKNASNKRAGGSTPTTKNVVVAPSGKSLNQKRGCC